MCQIAVRYRSRDTVRTEVDVRYVCQIAVRYRSRDTVCVSDKCLRWLRKDALGSLI